MITTAMMTAMVIVMVVMMMMFDCHCHNITSSKSSLSKHYQQVHRQYERATTCFRSWERDSAFSLTPLSTLLALLVLLVSSAMSVDPGTSAMGDLDWGNIQVTQTRFCHISVYITNALSSIFIKVGKLRQFLSSLKKFELNLSECWSISCR